MKYCTKCRTSKQKTEFWKNKSTKDGLQAHCKPCWYKQTKSKLEGPERDRYLRMRRNNHLQKKYGITADQYDEMLKAQGSTCAICHKDKDRISFSVDHDHDTGRIRGILCENCNRGIGMFKHDVQLLELAINYLQ